MKLIRPLLILFLIILAAFFLQNKSFDLKNLFSQFPANLNFTKIENSSTQIASNVKDEIKTLAENLPPPLKALSSGGALSSTAVLSNSEIIRLTNKERKDNGNLVSLSENAKLDAAALDKVKDMFAKQYFEHVSPTGVGPADLAKREDYQYIVIGENLALGNFKDDQALLDAWMNSPGHRANILNSRFRQMGAAVVKGTYNGQKVWLAVQEFGLPLSSCPKADATLLQTIENLKTDLNIKEQDLETKRAEINNANPKSGDAYNQKVSAYNQAVIAYNAELQVIKNDIATYNAEVNKFNSCAGNS